MNHASTTFDQIQTNPPANIVRHRHSQLQKDYIEYNKQNYKLQVELIENIVWKCVTSMIRGRTDACGWNRNAWISTRKCKHRKTAIANGFSLSAIRLKSLAVRIHQQNPICWLIENQSNFFLKSGENSQKIARRHTAEFFCEKKIFPLFNRKRFVDTRHLYHSKLRVILSDNMHHP